MPRQSTLALGLLSLALALGPTALAQAPKGDHAQAAATPGDPGHGDAAGHKTEAEPNILELRPSLAVATVIVFVALLAVLWRFAWGPLSKALNDRERQNEELVRQAEHARAESERLLAEHRAQMAQASDQVRSMLDAARRDAEHAAAETRRQAQADAEASREQARREIETARDQALVDIYTKTADLAVSVAGKVLSRELGPDDQRRLVDAATSELPTSPNGHGGHA
jgi:F-type H+-transporting ATPase subunit b